MRVAVRFARRVRAMPSAPLLAATEPIVPDFAKFDSLKSDVLKPHDAEARPVHVLAPDTLEAGLATLSPFEAAFARASSFDAKAGGLLLLPAADGAIGAALFGLGAASDAARVPLLYGKLATALPAGPWRLVGAVDNPTLAALGFALGSYRFSRYRTVGKDGPTLAVDPSVDRAAVMSEALAVALGRDLVNMPANDLGPAEIAEAVRAEAARAGVSVAEHVGDELRAAGFPLVHAVGKGSDRAPRLVHFAWGNPTHPKVTLIGKGVAYDTGGLDIKPSSSMALMKKDMGGAAAILALARMVIDAKLPVRLRVIIPTVENSISGRSFRTGDVYASRKGMTVEIGNTDAEGRLILADALTFADEEEPELIVDMATLTGAARVALGPDLPPFYTDDDALAAELQALSHEIGDPLWRLPLWPAYAGWLDSKIADTNHISSAPFAGSITAALFLKKFVERAKAWLHIDVYAWTPSAKPGRPEGGEVQAARAVFHWLKRRYKP
jgi:leucyl aminopeptidase